MLLICCVLPIVAIPGINLGMGSVNERRCYNITLSVTGWGHTQNASLRPMMNKWQSRHNHSKINMFLVKSLRLNDAWTHQWNKASLVRISTFQSKLNDWWLGYHLWNWSQMNYFGQGDGLVSSGNKPLPEPMLFHINFNSILFNRLFGFRRSQYTKKDEHVNVNKYKYHNNQSFIQDGRAWKSRYSDI